MKNNLSFGQSSTQHRIGAAVIPNPNSKIYKGKLVKTSPSLHASSSYSSVPNPINGGNGLHWGYNQSQPSSSQSNIVYYNFTPAGNTLNYKPTADLPQLRPMPQASDSEYHFSPVSSSRENLLTVRDPSLSHVVSVNPGTSNLVLNSFRLNAARGVSNNPVNTLPFVSGGAPPDPTPSGKKFVLLRQADGRVYCAKHFTTIKNVCTSSGVVNQIATAATAMANYTSTQTVSSSTNQNESVQNFLRTQSQLSGLSDASLPSISTETQANSGTNYSSSTESTNSSKLSPSQIKQFSEIRHHIERVQSATLAKKSPEKSSLPPQQQHSFCPQSINSGTSAYSTHHSHIRDLKLSEASCSRSSSQSADSSDSCAFILPQNILLPIESISPPPSEPGPSWTGSTENNQSSHQPTYFKSDHSYTATGPNSTGSWIKDINIVSTASTASLTEHNGFNNGISCSSGSSRMLNQPNTTASAFQPDCLPMIVIQDSPPGSCAGTPSKRLANTRGGGRNGYSRLVSSRGRRGRRKVLGTNSQRHCNTSSLRSRKLINNCNSQALEVVKYLQSVGMADKLDSAKHLVPLGTASAALSTSTPPKRKEGSRKLTKRIKGDSSTSDDEEYSRRGTPSPEPVPPDPTNISAAPASSPTADEDDFVFDFQVQEEPHPQITKRPPGRPGRMSITQREADLKHQVNNAKFQLKQRIAAARANIRNRGRGRGGSRIVGTSRHLLARHGVIHRDRHGRPLKPATSITSFDPTETCARVRPVPTKRKFRTAKTDQCARLIPYEPKRYKHDFNWFYSLAQKMATVTPRPQIKDPCIDGDASLVDNTCKPIPNVDFLALTLAQRYRLMIDREPIAKLGKSEIHGVGMFATRDIAYGELIIEYVGHIIRLSVANVRERMYARESHRFSRYYVNMFRIDDDFVIDATLHGGIARFINHSCCPNCVSKIIAFNGDKHIVIMASKSIVKDEEICFDYKLGYEKDLKIKCYCQSRTCRRFMN